MDFHYYQVTGQRNDPPVVLFLYLDRQIFYPVAGKVFYAFYS